MNTYRGLSILNRELAGVTLVLLLKQHGAGKKARKKGGNTLFVVGKGNALAIGGIDIQFRHVNPLMYGASNA